MIVMAMMQILFRMSLQGSIIIGIILLLRMVFRGLRISLPVLCAVVGNRLFLSHISLEDRECAWILAGTAGVDGSGGECGRTDGGNGTGNEHRAGAEYLTGAGPYDRAEYSAGE